MKLGIQWGSKYSNGTMMVKRGPRGDGNGQPRPKW